MTYLFRPPGFIFPVGNRTRRKPPLFKRPLSNICCCIHPFTADRGIQSLYLITDVVLVVNRNPGTDAVEVSTSAKTKRVFGCKQISCRFDNKPKITATSIYWVAAEADKQIAIFDSSTLKKRPINFIDTVNLIMLLAGITWGYVYRRGGKQAYFSTDKERNLI